MDQETLDKLYEDFVIEIKPGKGSFKYVRTRHILDRMNKVFKGNWGTHIISHSEIGDEVLVLAAVYIYSDNGDILAQQQGFGSAKKFNGVELGNTYKSATSKAIKSAVRNWGVALFLEEGEAIGTDYSNQNVKNVPNSMPSFTNNTPSAPPVSTPKNSTPVNVPNMNVPSMGVPSMGVPSTNSVPSSMSSMPSMPTTGGPVGGESTTFPASEPPTQEASLPTMVAVPGKMPSANAENTQSSITSVQKVAIMSRLASKGKTFEDICAEFYSNRPNSIFVDSIDNMTYTDALELVSFLNSK